MKLSLITELKFRKARRRMRPLLVTMPKSKQKHSVRVGRELHKAKAGKIATYAGLLHDYLERGGDPETLSQHIDELGLPQKIVDVVHSLSDDEKNVESSTNQPLEHLKWILQAVTDPDLRNIIILSKMSDRVDNLRKRARRGKIGRRYAAKSEELMQYLASHYTGEERPFKRLMHAYEATR